MPISFRHTRKRSSSDVGILARTVRDKRVLELIGRSSVGDVAQYVVARTEFERLVERFD